MGKKPTVSTPAAKHPGGRPRKIRTTAPRPELPLVKASPKAAVRTKKRQGARKINWPQIEVEYVQGLMDDGKRIFPSYEDLAHDHGVTSRAIAQHSAAGAWVRRREEYSSELRRKLFEITPERVAEIHANNLNTMKIFVDLATAKLGNKDENFATDHAALSKADIREARELLQIAKEAAEAMRAMLGQPTNITEQRVTQNTSATQQVAANVNVDIASAAAKSPDLVAALAAAMQAISTQKPADGAP